jgi:hypothetical protein
VALKGAEHEDNPAIVFLAQVSDGLDSTAVEINISDRSWPQDAECVEAFGRQVHVSAGIERSGGDKKHVLRFDETLGLIVDHGASFTHG